MYNKAISLKLYKDDTLLGIYSDGEVFDKRELMELIKHLLRLRYMMKPPRQGDTKSV